MPGAGGLLAANHLYARAERSGLVLGLPGRDWALTPTLQLPGGHLRCGEVQLHRLDRSGKQFWMGASGYKEQVDRRVEDGEQKIVIGALTPNTVTASVPKLIAAEGFPSRS